MSKEPNITVKLTEEAKRMLGYLAKKYNKDEKTIVSTIIKMFYELDTKDRFTLVELIKK
ncbi:hypothetical protein HXY33_05495 [Candidatus Bathyarchaeota archaeon]|nr:hypothetical protein [Candidatus Bathyarchaeota archaeon]